MIEHRYNGHIIHATAELQPASNDWTPRLVIQWNLTDGSFHDKAILFDKAFPTKEEAREHALLYGISWIDRGKPELAGAQAD